MWLPAPPKGTAVCGGFDGSESDDWTAIKLETQEGFIFTPRYGADQRPTIWNPKDWDGKIPRGQIHAAWAEIMDTFNLLRVYCDPGFHDETSYETEIEEWATEWPITHDGCPLTEAHMRNARKIMSRNGQTYTLGKPAHHQKIDAGVTTVICHEAAADQRAAGWIVEPDYAAVSY
jgi:hypothetical protein